MINYADVDLLVETEQIAGFMAAMLPLGNTRVTGPRPGSLSNFPEPPYDDIPDVNYPSAPAIGINTLYWPTGASRHGVFYALASEGMKNEIEKAVDGSTSTQTLKIGTSSTHQIEVPMHMLTPRPISAIGLGESDSQAAWLLPLVDQRYWWQFLNTGAISWSSSTTWATAFSDIATALGVTFTQDTVDADYLKPDWFEAARLYGDTGRILDAMCHSVGQRLIVIPDKDGTIEIVDFYNTGGEILSYPTIKDEWLIQAGGPMKHSTNEHHVPAAVHVICRKFADGTADADGDVYAYTKTPAATVFSSDDLETGTEHTIHTSAWADFTLAGGSPDNNTNLDALAAQIAADYYASLKVQYDYQFAGVVPWDFTPFDNWVLWTPIQTRVQTIPPNVGLRRMWHGDSDNATITVTVPPVSSTDCWIGNDSGTIRHRQPQADLDFADCAVYHKVQINPTSCGWYFDDAGHFMGYLDGAPTWHSPWSLNQPAS